MALVMKTKRNLTSRRKNASTPHIMSSFDHQILRINLRSLDFDLADEKLFKKSYEMMSLPKLKAATDSLELQAEDERRELVAYGRKSVALFEDSLDISSGKTSRHFGLAEPFLDRIETQFFH